MSLRVVQLLEPDQDLPVLVRTAIADGELERAGHMLMNAFDLTCEEAGALVDRPLCEDCCA